MVTSIKCISVGVFAKDVFAEFEKIRPNHTSFSMFLAIAAKHYIDTHNEPIDVYGEVPNYYSNIESWKIEIKKMSPKQKTATKRHSNSRPNKFNLKKRRRQIQDNVEQLRILSQG